MVVRRFALPLLALVTAACAQETVGSAGTSATPTPVASVQVRPSDLPVLPQEEAVVRGLRTVGVSAQVVGASKFANALGTPLPARVVRTGAGPRAGADVLFLDTPRDIRVCATPGSPGRTVYKVFVNGQQTSTNDAGQYVAYLVSSQFFVMAWDEEATDAIERGLSAAPARC